MQFLQYKIMTIVKLGLRLNSKNTKGINNKSIKLSWCVIDFTVWYISFFLNYIVSESLNTFSGISSKYLKSFRNI